ncbi:hypothetical protein P3L51_33335 [Streptomyces sp. PSRA5]|uniref:hypothetical protein n=1 Tax=Streptomyces panacea TaxID=3035064 RepID=UPI00339CB176
MGCLALLCGDMPRAERLPRSALGAFRELGEINSNVLMGQAEQALSLVFQGDLGPVLRALRPRVRGLDARPAR